MKGNSQLTSQKLTALRKKYPLPKGVPDAELNKEQVGQFMAVSPPTVSTWLSKGMPFVERGRNGSEYKFRAADVYAWHKAMLDQEQEVQDEAQRAIQAMRLELVGGGTNSSIDGLSPKDKREVFQTQMAHEQFMRERNELLVRDEVHDAFAKSFSIVRDALDSLPDELHREASLNNHQLGVLNEICDRVLQEMVRAHERFFDDRPVHSGDRRTDLFQVN